MLPRVEVGTSDGRRVLAWWCPGCERRHEVPLEGEGAWSWEGGLSEPTLKPTVIVTRRRSPDAPALSTCHSRIVKGEIQYLPASTHALAGQTVAMEPV